MTVLGIDTSNQSMLLSLGDNKQVLATYMTKSQKNHSVTLMPGIEFLMAGNNKQPKDLTKIIIAEGPGSYTGLRIGVTTAKTLAWTLGIDLYAVSTLALIAASKTNVTGLIVPLINARRDNVYTGAYKWEDNQLITVIEDQHIAITDWFKVLKKEEQPVHFVGLDTIVFKELIEAEEVTQFLFSEDEKDNLLQGGAFFRLDNQLTKIEDVEAFIPKYLKKVEAEEKWLETHQEQEGSHYVERV